MKDPARLLDHGATQEELALLRAVASEEPSDHARARLAAALGVSIQAVAPAAAASAAKVGAGARVLALVSGSGGKWLAIVAGAAVGGALLAGRPSEDERATSYAAAAEDVSVQAPDAREGVGSVMLESPPPQQDGPRQLVHGSASLAGQPPDREAGKRVNPLPNAEPRGARSITDEIALLDQARRALSAGQPTRALATLTAYERQHPRGMLRQEAQLLRIEALSKAGDPGSARRLTTRFLRDNPRTPHEERVQALVRETP